MPKGNIAKTLPYVAQTVSGADQLDLTFALTNGIIDQIQAAFIDNSNGSLSFALTIQSTGMTIKAKPFSQGWYPLLVSYPNGGLLLFGQTGALTPLFFTNVPMPVGDWEVNLNTGTGSPASPLSTIITNGGTPVVVFGPGPANGAVLVNPYDASESLFVDMINPAGTTVPGTHGTTVELKAGGAFTVPPGFTGPVYANAVTNGHTFTAYGQN